MSVEANLSVMRRFFELASQHDVDRLLESIHQDYVGDGDVLSEPVRGKAAYGALLRWFYAVFPDARYEVEQMIAAGAEVVTRVRLKGTQRGTFMGHEGTGQPFAIRLCHVDELRDAQIIRAWYYWDTATLLRQLGLDATGPVAAPAARRSS